MCNSNLKKWGKSNTDECEVCHVEEDIVHLLFACRHAQSLWNFVRKTLDISLTEVEFVCGKKRDNPKKYCITLIGYLIYKEWLICKDLNINQTSFKRKAFLCSELRFRAEVLH